MESCHFIEESINDVPGWLVRDAAYLTFFLVDVQQRVSTGPLMEIGVYGGRYLSILYEASKSDSSARVILGIDIFTDISEDAVVSNIRTVCGDVSRLRLLRTDSTLLRGDGVLDSLLGMRPRFISIDGLHTSEAVCSDLLLAEAIIGASGIVALDDFLNPLAIGVCGGFYKFFMGSTGLLVPLAFGSNKLYLCTKASRGFYEEAIFRFARDYDFLPTTKDFAARQLRGRQWIEQEMLSHKVLIL
jgi:Methyltransferase domain